MVADWANEQLLQKVLALCKHLGLVADGSRYFQLLIKIKGFCKTMDDK